MRNFNRRAFLACGLLGTQSLLAACGGGGGEEAEVARVTEPVTSPAPTTPTTPTTPTAPSAPTAPSNPTPSAPPTAPAPEWHVGLPLAFAAGSVASIDLRNTLPAGVVRGGVFSLDPSSTRLPAGVSLASNGVLTVATGATVSVTSGIVFAYNEP